MVRQSLDIRLGQHLTLTPALQQSIKLLQLSSLDLQAEIERALDENPMLESDSTSDDTPEALPVVQKVEAGPVSTKQTELYSGSRYSRDDEQTEQPESGTSLTLREHLLGQLGTMRVSEREAAIVSLLIDDLNDDGFLESSLEDICGMLDPAASVDLEELQIALRLLQSFDPSGIGARHLSECLSLQLHQAAPDWLPALLDSQVLRATQSICKDHLRVLASGNLVKLQKLLDCDSETLQQAQACILKLNPRPGSPWSKPAADYAIADVIVHKTSLGFKAILNESALPKLNVNHIYAQALGSARSGEHTALHGQLQEARWLIRNIKQRFETILRVSEFIVSHQQLFFEKGWGSLKPLTLREVAGDLALHESTISRATNQKFMLTPFGTIELKRFFTTGLSNSDGQTTSSMAVQTKIRDLISHEDVNKPLSDGQLAILLDKEGIQVARRTVAKYRELMRIPSATMRKSQGLARR